MAIVTLTNSTSPNTVERATDDQDPYERETQLDSLAHNFDDHDHTAGKNLGVGRVQITSAPAAAGQVRVNGDTWQWWAAAAAAVRTAVDLEGPQTVAGQKRFDAIVSLGVAPEAGWAATYNVLRLGARGALRAANAGSDTTLSENSYYDGTDNRAVANAAATAYRQLTGTHLWYTAPAVAAGAVQTFTEWLRLTEGGTLYVNDTANANMTVGLTLNQGSGDAEILALKSSDVAHGITDAAETDTYGDLLKAVADSGGLAVRGLTEATVALAAQGYGVTDDPTHNATGRAYVELIAGKKSGTGVTDAGANANLFAVRNVVAGAQFLVDAEGDMFNNGASGTSTTYDDADDGALIEALTTLMNPAREQGYKFRLARDLEAHKAALAAGGVITLNPDGSVAMLSYKGVVGLLVDAIRQVTHAHRELEARVAPLLGAR